MDSLLPLVGFAFASSITPGPNNLMLSASGIAFGLRRTLPHLIGVAVGFVLLLAVCAMGVGALIVAFPSIAVALKVLGTLYLLRLTWTLRNALVPENASSSARPLRFAEAALFQFVNPKAWIMALTAVTAFVPDIEPRWLAVGVVCAVFELVSLPCVCTWAVLGVTLRRWLAIERWRDFFSLMIAVLMLYAVAAMWVDVTPGAAPSANGRDDVLSSIRCTTFRYASSSTGTRACSF